MVLQARVGRNVDGLDLKLYDKALQLRRQFEKEHVHAWGFGHSGVGIRTSKKGFKSIWMEIIFDEGVCESKMKLNLASFIPDVVVLTYQRQCGFC
jgi:hypothetical protein